MVCLRNVPLIGLRFVTGLHRVKSAGLALCCAGLLLPVAGVAQGNALRAGAAKVEVTPPVPAGFQGPTGKYEHEHLFVRAIVVDDGAARAVLIGADQSGLNDAVWKAATERIAKDVNCPVANILMSATHTHSPGVAFGPATGAGAALPPNDQRVVDAMVEATHDAKGKLQAAQMSFGTENAYLNVNRDAINPETHLWTQGPNPLAASDKTVAVLEFKSLTGEPIGVYVNYAMHPVNGYLADFTSADFAGETSRYVEQAFSDKAVAIFTQGASGDQNPLYLRAATNGMASRSGMTIPGTVLVRESVEAPLRDGPVQAKPMDAATRDHLERWMQTEGDLLGEIVLHVMTDATRTQKEARIWGKQVDISCPGRTRTDKGREGMTATYSSGPAVPIRLGVIGIGDVALTSVDAEIYTLISQRLKRQSPMANTMMVTLANGRAPSGYIPDDASFSHNSFQVLGSRLTVGCAEQSISDTLTDLVTEYAHKKS